MWNSVLLCCYVVYTQCRQATTAHHHHQRAALFQVGCSCSVSQAFVMCVYICIVRMCVFLLPITAPLLFICYTYSVQHGSSTMISNMLIVNNINSDETEAAVFFPLKSASLFLFPNIFFKATIFFGKMQTTLSSP